MSYCRFSDGDVYMYPTINGIECCVCKLTKKKHYEKNGIKIKMHSNVLFDTNAQAIAHLEEHIKAGHSVPKYAIERLQEELGD